jgi:peptide/nickel transport system permease protein
MIILALLSPLVANERPWYIRMAGQSYSPLLWGLAVDADLRTWPSALLPAEDWADKPHEQIIFTLIPYSPSSIDHRNLGAKGPFERQRIVSWRFRHWLGTDAAGRDVAAGMLHGTRMALWVGLVAVSIAMLMGLVFGGLAGYFGDQRLILAPNTLWAVGLPLPLLLFYWAYLPGLSAAAGWWVMLGHFLGYFALYALLVFALSRILKLIFAQNKRVTVPLDTVLMRILEVVDAIPAIILLLALLVILREPSTTAMMALVGLVNSATVARFVRAEFLKVRQQTYMEAGRALGFGHRRLIFRHALPNAVGPLLVLLSFSMGTAILAESTLAVLGVGPADRVTWGSILGQLRGQHEIEWWLAVFPGLAIFFTILTFRYLSEGISEALGEK